MVTVTLHVRSKLSDVEMAKLLSVRAPEVCDGVADIIKDVAGLPRDSVDCEMSEAVGHGVMVAFDLRQDQTLRKGGGD